MTSTSSETPPGVSRISRPPPNGEPENNITLSTEAAFTMARRVLFFGSRCVMCLPLFGIIALAVIGTPAAFGEDWYRYRGPALNGVSSETEWTEKWGDRGPRILWKQSVGTGFSGVVTSNNRAYTIGNSDNVDTVHCLDATTGNSICAMTTNAQPTRMSLRGGQPRHPPSTARSCSRLAAPVICTALIRFQVRSCGEET